MKYLTYLGITLFAYILTTLNLSALLENMNKIHFIYLLLAFLLNVPMIYFKSYRWKLILSDQKILLTSKQAFEYYMSSLYLGFVTPGRLGELSRVFYIEQNFKDTKFGSLFSSVITDRLFDLYLLVSLTIIGFLFLSLHIPNQYTFSFFIIFFLVPFVLLKTSLLSLFIQIISKKLSIKSQQKTQQFIDSFSKAFKKTLSFKNIIKFAILSISSYIIFFLQTYLITMGMNLQIDFLTVVFIMAISNTISLLPISISGIGTRDLILIYFLAPFGVGKEHAVLFSTIILLIFFVGCSLIGFFYHLKNPINLQSYKD